MGSFITKVNIEDMIGYTIENVSVLRPSNIKWNGESADYYDGEIVINTDNHEKHIYANYRCRKTGEYGKQGIVTDCENNTIELNEIKDLQITNIEKVVIMNELILSLGIRDYEYYKITDQHNQIWIFNVIDFFTYDDDKYIRTEI